MNEARTNREGLNRLSELTEKLIQADIDLKLVSSAFETLIKYETRHVSVVDKTGRLVLESPSARKIWGGDTQDVDEPSEWRDVYDMRRVDGTPMPAEELPGYISLVEGRACIKELIVGRTGKLVRLSTYPVKDELHAEDPVLGLLAVTEVLGEGGDNEL